MNQILFLPKPQSVSYTGPCFQAPEVWRVRLPQNLYGIRQGLMRLWPELVLSTEESNITFCYDKNLPREGYRLELSKDGAFIWYCSKKGAFYGMCTLKQAVIQSGGRLPCCRVIDSPALKLRGVLFDISRGKVPALETLKQAADIMASLKLNHLELYIEGFSFGYPSFPQMWREDSCLLPHELQELAACCRDLFIELVPHQNSLGHMAPWLALPEYKKLAEAEEGLRVMGKSFPPTTLDAADPGSLALVKRLIGDLKPSFDSGLFHVGLDEAFEFGKGKNQSLIENQGGAGLILPYIHKLHEILHEEGFQMMIWDDMLVKYPEIARQLPDDILILNWGYDGEYPVEQRAQYLRDLGRRFCLSPGTSSWSSFTGLTDNMLENIRCTALAAHAYGAEGMLVTDWGDMNHLQYQPVSYPGLACFAAWAWNPKGISEEELARALNLFVFQDTAGLMGELSLKAGRFYQREEFRLPCRSLASLPLMFGRLPLREYEKRVAWLVKSVTFFSPPEVCRAYLDSYEKRKDFQAEKLYGFLEECRQTLSKVSLKGLDGALIVREYQNAIRMLLYLTQVREEIIDGSGTARYGSLYPDMIEEHKSLWNERNKRSGLYEGIEMFQRI